MSGEIDRKRSFDGEESALKRFEKSKEPLSKLSEDGPLTQNDVIYFQKEAIWRQMNHYKNQTNMLIKDVNFYKLNYEATESKINIIDSWYEQIIKLFGIADKDNDGVEDDDSILIRLNNQSTTSINYQLDKRREYLIKLLKPIIENSKISNIESKDLIDKYEKLNQEFNWIKSEKETLSKMKNDLENRLESLQEELLVIHKERERKNSKTLKRVDESLVKEEETQSNGHSEIKKEEEKVKEDEPIKEEINKEEVEKLSVEIKELQAVNQVLSKQLSEINHKIEESEQEKDQMKNRLNNLSEEELKKSNIYIEMVERNNKLNEDLSEVNKLKDGLIKKIEELENGQGEYSKMMNAQVIEENEQLKNQLNKSEQDLVRIRTTRDELISKQTILKQEIDNKQTNEELNKLNKVLSEQITTLQEQKEERSGSGVYENLDKEELIRRINGLNNEIKEIEMAFQQSREISIKKFDQLIEHDNLIKKLSIEKTKADQKYFASMRSKDSLTNENKVLKSQLVKLQELIKNLNEVEKNYLNKIEILTKSINDYKMIKEGSIQENSNLQELVKITNLKYKNIETEYEKIQLELSQFKQKNHSCETTLKQNEIQINKLESKLKQVENLLDKYKSNNTSSLLQEDEKQLEALRSIAKCSVCSKNWKDTAITVCGHVFCQSCTQERLAARLRRCPSCNKGFSANDLLSIHL